MSGWHDNALGALHSLQDVIDGHMADQAELLKAQLLRQRQRYVYALREWVAHALGAREPGRDGEEVEITTDQRPTDNPQLHPARIISEHPLDTMLAKGQLDPAEWGAADLYRTDLELSSISPSRFTYAALFVGGPQARVKRIKGKRVIETFPMKMAKRPFHWRDMEGARLDAMQRVNDARKAINASRPAGGNGNLVAFGGNNTEGPINVATACRAKGGTGHRDFETETFICSTVAGSLPVDLTNGRVGGDVAGTLEHAQEKGNRGQGVIAFDTTQITHPENRCQPVAGDPCHPLAAHAHAPALALLDVADPVCANEARTYTHEGQNNFRLRNVVPAGAWAVRRLTATECERLMGQRDGFTAITYRGKPAADGPRYKALGNGMAVNCMRWIGERIDKLERRVRRAA